MSYLTKCAGVARKNPEYPASMRCALGEDGANGDPDVDKICNGIQDFKVQFTF